ncbi:MAG TPA: hypothetical protein VGK48_04060 [Terriglobia bacterium]
MRAARPWAKIGLSKDEDVLLFVVLMLLYPNYYQHPLITRILSDPGLSPGDRLEKVVADVPEDEWMQVIEAQS